jgi:SAM-dependent MidA family methyltransferase
MEQALYHPQHGYYSSGRAKLGRQGDYFTNVSVGPMFGRLLAFQFAEMWEQLERPGSFTIVEQGAHDGQFAHDVLRAISEFSPEFFKAVRYIIVEPSPVLRETQRTALSEFDQRIDWSDSLETIEPFSGVHFSNELLDAMPVHTVRRTNGTQWMEKLVDWKDDQFAFVEAPVRDPRLNEQLNEFRDVPGEVELEINLATLDWVTAVSRKLERGFCLANDYGFVAPDFAAPQHRTGTLQCRAQHRVIDSPFDFIGNCDITAHVNWTAIARHAEKTGLTISGFTDQHHFLTGIIAVHPEAAQSSDPGVRRQLQTLLHPEMMGRSFQALLLSRGTAPYQKLSGFKFAREPVSRLGLGAADSN